MTEAVDWTEWRTGHHRSDNHADRRRRAGAKAIRSYPAGGLDPEALLEFVLRSRVLLLAERTWLAEAPSTSPRPGAWVPADGKRYDTTGVVSQSAIAEVQEHGRSTMSKWITSTHREDVLKLEQDLMMFAYTRRNASSWAIRSLGWLTSFRDEIIPGPTRYRGSSLLGRWHHDLCLTGPQNSAEALAIGEAFLALLGSATNAAGADAIWSRHHEDGMYTCRALTAVACKPPRGGTIPATQLAALLGYRIVPYVEEEVKRSAVGFRALRIVTRILRSVRTDPPEWWSVPATEELQRCWKLLSDIGELTKPGGPGLPDPYPARSFYVEALREAGRVAREKPEIAPFSTADVERLLRQRFVDPDRPLRERAYAALCLHEIDPYNHDELLAEVEHQTIAGDEMWVYLGVVLREMRSRTLEQLILDDISHFDAKLQAVGSSAAAIVLRHRKKAGTDAAQPRVLSFLQRLPVPIQPGMRQLLRYALLSPDGTARRMACEALLEAGVTAEASGIVIDIMRDRETPRWLRENCAFVLGLLRDPTSFAALEQVAVDRGEHDSVRHAAIWSLGDLRDGPRGIVALFRELINDGSNSVVILHAATYALAATRVRPNEAEPSALSAHSRRPAQTEEEEIADQIACLSGLMAGGEDLTIRLLARWGYETQLRGIRLRQAQNRREVELWEMGKLAEVAISSSRRN
jgi:hypothetical protein